MPGRRSRGPGRCRRSPEARARKPRKTRAGRRPSRAGRRCGRRACGRADAQRHRGRDRPAGRESQARTEMMYVLGARDDRIARRGVDHGGVREERRRAAVDDHDAVGGRQRRAPARAKTSLIWAPARAGSGASSRIAHECGSVVESEDRRRPKGRGCRRRRSSESAVSERRQQRDRMRRGGRESRHEHADGRHGRGRQMARDDERSVSPVVGEPTDPAESSDWKRETQTSSKARDSRGPSERLRRVRAVSDEASVFRRDLERTVREV